MAVETRLRETQGAAAFSLFLFFFPAVHVCRKVVEEQLACKFAETLCVAIKRGEGRAASFEEQWRRNRATFFHPRGDTGDTIRGERANERASERKLWACQNRLSVRISGCVTERARRVRGDCCSYGRRWNEAAWRGVREREEHGVRVARWPVHYHNRIPLREGPPDTSTTVHPLHSLTALL